MIPPCGVESHVITTPTCEGLYDATMWSGVSCSSLRARIVLAPFLIRKVAEKESPRRMARWRRLFPSGSKMSRLQLCETRVLAISSCRFSRAKFRGRFPSLSHSSSLWGSCRNGQGVRSKSGFILIMQVTKLTAGLTFFK